ncbi:replication-relaxation family protein [Culicoidibacter larvae]|uniref:Replication-relaxation n=1 Tax=Culicoidibacter larvae TaxID=2579976 RepID=A0A5R8Q6U9_9FIRM|nr:replication-relaxation family protein [Culicoidibacter larvae]TLG71073.1 hypothetical protein FEZ08_11720 [Culicoidibacter larvae]
MAIKNLTHNDLIFLAALQKFQYLDKEIVYKFYYRNLKPGTIKNRIEFLLSKHYIQRFLIGKKGAPDYRVIYAIHENGFYVLQPVDSKERFDIESAMHLKSSYMHYVNTAKILLAYNELPGTDIYVEKGEAHHFFGKEKEYNDVIRPDGGILIKKQVCLFLEYENEQKRRSLANKLERYNKYAVFNKIVEHPVIEASQFELLFVFNTKRKMDSFMDDLQKYPVKGYRIRGGVLADVLNNPVDGQIFRTYNGGMKDV